VDVHVVGDTRTGDVSEVPAEVEAVGVVGPFEHIDADDGQAMEIERLAVVELPERADVADRGGHQVSRRVGELVQEHQGTRSAVDEERRLDRHLACGLGAEDAGLELVRVLDVLETPGSPQRLRHDGRSTSAPADVARTAADPYTRPVVSYGLKLAAAGIAFLCLGVLVIIIFSGIWTRVGLGAALIIVFGGLLFLAWRGDRKAKKAREGLERI